MRSWRLFVSILLAAAVFGAASDRLNRLPRKLSPDQLDVAIAPPIEVMLAGGDRFLAADINAIRLIVLNVFDLDKQDYPILARVHRDVAFLHPCHEDNYYVAQAFLPWIGEVDAADEILKRAGQCRTWDIMPGFLQAFNAFYFRKDNLLAGRIYAETAERVQGNDKDKLLFSASKFLEKGEDLTMAAAIIRDLEKNAVNDQLKLFLRARAQRVEILKDLRSASKIYRERQGKPLESLHELVAVGLLERVPDDPLGKGFEIDAAGIVQPRN